MTGGLKTRSASFGRAGKKVVKEVGKVGKTAALKVRRLRAANLTFEADGLHRTFAIVHKLGEGGYSTIWSVRERQPDGSEVEYAVKRVLIDGSDSEQLALVEGEIAAMRSLPPHPNVITLLGFCRKPRAPAGGGRGSLDEFYLLLEMCAGGSLAGLLQRRDKEGAPKRPEETLRIFLDMCHAVAHMHALQHPLAHRDVKPENFVLSEEDGYWKLCDFGSASTEHFQHGEGTRPAAVAAEEERVHRFSTPQYRAPEMCDVRRGEPVGVKVDVWALGVSLYKMMYLKDLFGVAGEEKLAILNFRPDQKLPPPTASEDPLQALLGELMRLCLTQDVTRRPAASQLLQLVQSRGSALPRQVDLEGAAAAARPGVLTLHLLGARELCAKDLLGQGAKTKAYVGLLCAGQARRSQLVHGGLAPQWHETFHISTHSMATVHLSVWRHSRLFAEDFLGAVALPLSGLLLGRAHLPLDQPPSWRPLQRRSARSHVSGELELQIGWNPLISIGTTPEAPPQAAAAAPMLFDMPPGVASGQPFGVNDNGQLVTVICPPGASPGHPVQLPAAAGDPAPEPVNATAAPSASTAAAARPAAATTATGASISGGGTFWDSFATAQSPPAAPLTPELALGLARSAQVAANWAAPPVALEFTSCVAHSAPWEVAANATNDDGFWAEFDARGGPSNCGTFGAAADMASARPAAAAQGGGYSSLLWDDLASLEPGAASASTSPNLDLDRDRVADLGLASLDLDLGRPASAPPESPAPAPLSSAGSSAGALGEPERDGGGRRQAREARRWRGGGEPELVADEPSAEIAPSVGSGTFWDSYGK